MDRMVACCGLVCTDCEAYKATQKGDWEALQQLAGKWSKEFNTPLSGEDCLCDGCLATTGRQIGYCRECEIRGCGVARAVENCARCPDYACDKLEKFLGSAPQARTTLEELRQSL
jgi:hypothetical protein